MFTFSFLVYDFHAHEETRYDELETGLSSLAVALTREAVLSAREIAKSPFLSRGGPWSHPAKLTETQLTEAEKVAECNTPEEVLELCTDGRTALSRHLANVSFCTETVENVQRVSLRTSNRSGTPGNKVRRDHLDKERYKQNDELHQQAQRGKDAKARREAETERRPSRAKKMSLYTHARCADACSSTSRLHKPEEQQQKT